MAEFDDSDVADATLEPSFWDTRAKKAPVGCSKKYTEMIGGLMILKKNDSYDNCMKAIGCFAELHNNAASLPMIKSKLKPNKAFFKAVARGQTLLYKKKSGYAAETEHKGRKRDQDAGKFEGGVGIGEDMSDARRDKLKSMGKF